LAVFQSERVASAGGRKGGLGGIPPALQILGEISSNFFERTPQLGNVFVSLPSARARQPILSANRNFLSLPRCYGTHQKRASFIFNWTNFIKLDSITLKG